MGQKSNEAMESPLLFRDACERDLGDGALSIGARGAELVAHAIVTSVFRCLRVVLARRVGAVRTVLAVLTLAI